MLHQELGIPRDYFRRNLQLQEEAQGLITMRSGPLDEPFEMTPETFRQWKFMCASAAADGIHLYVSTAFRSLEDQAELIRMAMEQTGSSIDAILNWILAPGYTEHHTGRALDIGFSDCGGIPTAELVEQSPRFQWLMEHAGDFGFALSYPRGNPQGVIFEPWHWCCQL